MAKPEDARSPLHDLLPHLADTTHVIGACYIDDGKGGSFRCAIARLILPDEELVIVRDWPSGLIYRRGP